MRVRIDPVPGLAVGIRIKAPGERMVGKPTELLISSDVSELMSPYERLLGDALAGDPTLFASQSEVEAQWRVVDPVLKNPPPVHVYEPGTWGPPEADGLMANRGGWRIPSLPPFTSGDRMRFDPAQDLSSNVVKVVRIDRDGTIPKDNPFVGKPDARGDTWSLGHRNILSAAVHPGTGQLWVAEMGPLGGDEPSPRRQSISLATESRTSAPHPGVKLLARDPDMHKLTVTDKNDWLRPSPFRAAAKAAGRAGGRPWHRHGRARRATIAP